MKGFARWLREERMRPGRGWKSFCSAIAAPGNVRKIQDRQGVAGAAHIARRGRTLPDQPKTQTKTTDRSVCGFRQGSDPSGRVTASSMLPYIDRETLVGTGATAG
jgi:hypothetical protein